MKPTAQVTKYVAGFLFSKNCQQVALIRKNKPKWQAGKLNGIGGKIEDGETAAEAMRREFLEETNGFIPFGWQPFATLTDHSTFSVEFFAAFGEPEALTSREEERVECVPVGDITPLRADMIENLPWLISLAIDFLEDGRPNNAVIVYPTQDSVPS